MNPTIKWIFLSFLLAIELLSLLWFGMILKVAINAIRSGNAEDERSDDEEEEEEEVEVIVSPKHESLNGAAAERASGAESAWRRANAPAPSRRAHAGILGESDRKALLGRIGCDKPTHD